MMKAIVIGCGFAGAVTARRLAESGFNVEILERRGQIAGNMYDETDENGVLVHRYGPHIFHTNDDAVWHFISRFGQWYPFELRTSALIEGKIVPMPFNFTAIDLLFQPDQAEKIRRALIERYGEGTHVPVLELINGEDETLRQMALFFYEKDYFPYTSKQWGLSPTQIDPSVTARVPFRASYEDRVFLDKYQFMPRGGFTALFKDLLDHPNIRVQLGVDGLKRISLDTENRKVLADGEIFEGPVVYTGAVDELFGYRLGVLPYRSLEFEYATVEQETFQPTLGVCYPDFQYPITRIVEYKHLMEHKPDTGRTTIVREYPMAFDKDGAKGNIPYYPIVSDAANAAYQPYRAELKQYPNLFAVGRLAEYQYYYMDKVIARALEAAAEIIKEYKSS